MTSEDFKNDPAHSIAGWFREHENDDGDFFSCDETWPFHVLRRPDDAQRIVLATKVHVARAASEHLSPGKSLGIIVVAGLPTVSDEARIAHEAAGREVLFLGDLDPADLMIYTWLRARLRPLRVTHFGINDNYLQELSAQIPQSYQIALGPTELLSLEVLKTAAADIETVVGSHCAQVLDNGFKIEIEAVVSALGSAQSLLLPALR